jgi:hypothetical protein
MISLHVLATKSRTKISVPIGTPIPTKPSGQKLVRARSAERCVKVGLAVMKFARNKNKTQKKIIHLTVLSGRRKIQ